MLRLSVLASFFAATAARMAHSPTLKPVTALDVFTSGLTSVKRPSSLSRARRSQRLVAQLAAGWISCVDAASGQSYYYNEQTGQTQWDMPQHGHAQRTWRVGALNGIKGSFKDEELGTMYGTLPYSMRNGDEFLLGRFNMVREMTSVSRIQAAIQVLPDGTAILVSRGKVPTLWRSRGGAWNGLNAGETHIVGDGDNIGLDANDPESAVFMIHDCTPPGSQQRGLPLPAGWVSGVDEASGHIYFYNQQTGQSQWEAPQQ